MPISVTNAVAPRRSHTQNAKQPAISRNAATTKARTVLIGARSASLSRIRRSGSTVEYDEISLMIRRLGCLLALLLLAGSPAASAAGQENGRVVGRVVDQTGGVLPGVMVELVAKSRGT